MAPGRRRLLSFAVGVVLAVGLWVGLTSFTAPGPARARPFSLPRLGVGPPVSVPIVGEGAHDPVVLTFFASWCGPCHSELPSLALVARRDEAAGDRVRFIGVDDNDAPASGLAFARASGVDFPVGRDSLSLVAPTYGLQGNPATVFIDADGDVAQTVRGPIRPAALQAEIARIDGT
ncbi:MAG TPA: TlpA disulfide reductase family protein [Acidimicrobiales bacterium]|nr:TlpA disulfide reductase family protein [Acidimicrobiales bacterium]